MTCGTQSGVLALAHQLNFSIKKSRPVHHKTAAPEVLKKYANETIISIKEHIAAGCTVLCLDAAAMRNSGSSARGICLRGGREIVSVNFSMVSTTMIGALGVDKCHINFCKSANSANVIEMLEQLRAKYGNVFIILDNASAHKSKAIKEYLAETAGDVVLWYRPPYTPQRNPIEILWREIKHAVAGRYFEGGFEQMEKSIHHMLRGQSVYCQST